MSLEPADLTYAYECIQNLCQRNPHLIPWGIVRVAAGFFTMSALHYLNHFVWDHIIKLDMDLRTRCEIWQFVCDVESRHEFDPANLKPQAMQD